MAMPTRLPVLLQRRKSAAAGCAKAATPVSAIAAGSKARVTKPRMDGSSRGKSTLIRPGSFPKGGISREGSGGVNEDGPEVINIGEGRSGHQQIPERGEEWGGIVVGQKRGRIEAKGAAARRREAIAEGPGRIVGRTGTPVGSIRVGRQDGHAASSLERDGQRQGIFLIGPALAALLVQCHRQLSAGEDHGAAT